MAPIETMCQVCFEWRKCRTKYLGRDDLLVCTAIACLTKNTERKKEF